MRSDSLLAAPNTLFRLCVRWYALAAVWFMLMATFSPALFLGDDGFDVLAGQALTSGRDATLPALHLMLQIVVTPLVLVSVLSAGTKLPSAKGLGKISAAVLGTLRVTTAL